jgi:hypothetical protein
VTIAGNTARLDGGGVNTDGGTVNIGNSLVAMNTDADNGATPDVRGSFVSQGNNLIGNIGTATGFTNGVNGDKVGGGANPVIDPKIGALSTNGVTIPTRALQAGSPAIDAGSNALATGAGLTTDQRGFTRIVDGNNDTVATVDIGAFEVQAAPTAATVVVSGHVTTLLGRGISGVNLSLTDSDGNTRTTVSTAGGYYQFTDVRVGETYIISASGKRFTFSQPVQVLNISEETNGVDFIANSEKRLRAF